MLSKKIKYGYFILKNLQETNEDNKKKGKEALKGIEVPYNLGLTILTELVNGNLIESEKGKKGGFYIRKKEISLLELYKALEYKKILKLEDSKEEDSGYKDLTLRFNKALLNELEETKISIPERET